MKVYIAGPLSAGTREEMLTNVERAVLAGDKVRQLGHLPFVPHLTLFADEIMQRAGRNVHWSAWVEEDLHWLEACDALLIQGEWQDSKGSWVEYIFAKHAKMKVFESLVEFECWCKESCCRRTSSLT